MHVVRVGRSTQRRAGQVAGGAEARECAGGGGGEKEKQEDCATKRNERETGWRRWECERLGNFVTVGRVRVSTASHLHRRILIRRPRSRHASVRAEWLWAEYVEWAKFKVVFVLFILFFFFIEN